MSNRTNDQNAPQSDEAQHSLNNRLLYRDRVHALDHGRIRRLGFLERQNMLFLGWRDGRRGLPAKNDAGNWQSAHLDQEVNAYEEFSSRQWGNLLIQRETIHKQLHALVVSISVTFEQLCSARKEIEKALLPAQELTVRKAGEEKLTEDQVRDRRTREQEHRLAPQKARARSLQDSIEAQIEQFCQLQSMLPEDVNITRMICNRVKDHTLARADVYWSAAHRRHPERASMPTIPGLELPHRAEDLFMASHAERMKEVDALRARVMEIRKEVE